LRDVNYFNQSSGAILLYDVSKRTSYKFLPYLQRDVHRVCDKIPICIVGNKCDLKNRCVKPLFFNYTRKYNLPYYEVSAINNHHIFNPFLYFARTFFSDPNLIILEYPEVNIVEHFTLDPDYSYFMEQLYTRNTK